jgi:integrase/recombinase XerD
VPAGGPRSCEIGLVSDKYPISIFKLLRCHGQRSPCCRSLNKYTIVMLRSATALGRFDCAVLCLQLCKRHLCCVSDHLFRKGNVMAQASVLTDNEIRRVFRIIETTRHADRNRLAFVLSVYAGFGSEKSRRSTLVMSPLKTARLGARSSSGRSRPRARRVARTVVLSNRVRSEIDAHLKNRPRHHHDAPLIASQRNGRPFSNVSLSMLFKEIYESAEIRTSSHSGRRTFATRLNAKGVGIRTIQKLMGHRYIGTTAPYCDVSEDTLRNAVELV